LFRDKEFDHEKDIEIERRVLDEEAELSSHFEENSVDLLVSNLSMHWINDLPGIHIS
jgi:NADH dehydrogenase [ubiquinone] 1 alpha subcomplex assembly factor 5